MAQIRVNNVTLEYDIAGPDGAPAVLLVMGFGNQMTAWPEDFRQGFIAAGFRVVRFDNRDVGLTQKFSGIPSPKAVTAALAEGKKPDVPYTLNDMADDAAGLLAALGIDSAHVVGASMGGMIAQLVAIRHPAKVRSLISMMSTTSEPSLPRSTPEAQAALMARPASNDKDAVVAHTLEMRKAFASTKFPHDPVKGAAIVAANYDRSFYPEGTARQWAAILATPPRTDALKRLRVPALVLHGSSDTLIHPDAGRHTAASIPGATLRIIDGWGHDMPHSAMPVLLGEIIPFITRVENERDEALSRPAAPGCCGAAVAQ